MGLRGLLVKTPNIGGAENGARFTHPPQRLHDARSPDEAPGQERLSNGPDKASYGRQSLWLCPHRE